LKSLYKAYRKHELTIEEYQSLLEGSKIKTEKEAGEKFFHVNRSYISGAQVTKPYYELVIRANSNEVIKKIYAKEKCDMPEFDHKVHPSEYFPIFDLLEREELRYIQHSNGVPL
jgi:hypothetical protein